MKLRQYWGASAWNQLNAQTPLFRARIGYSPLAAREPDANSSFTSPLQLRAALQVR